MDLSSAKARPTGLLSGRRVGVQKRLQILGGFRATDLRSEVGAIDRDEEKQQETKPGHETMTNCVKNS